MKQLTLLLIFCFLIHPQTVLAMSCSDTTAESIQMQLSEILTHLKPNRPVVARSVKEWTTLADGRRVPIVETVSGVVKSVDLHRGFVRLQDFDIGATLSIDSILHICSWNTVREASPINLGLELGKVAAIKKISHWVEVSGKQFPVVESIVGTITKVDLLNGFIRVESGGVGTTFNISQIKAINVFEN